MPGFDRTGPWGMGPRTGRGLGLCGPGPRSYGYGMRGAGRGLLPWGGGRGRAWGGGRGFGWQGYGASPGYGYSPDPYVPLTEEQEIEALRSEASFLEKELQAVQKRLAQFEKESKK
jgi:hypothetical protein